MTPASEPRRGAGARAAVVASLPETMPEKIAERLAASGIAPLAGKSEALAALRLAAEIGEVWARPAPAPLAPPTSIDALAHTLDEAEAKRALARHGLSVRPFRVAAAGEAGAAAAEIGFPVVAKAVSAALAHKSEAGGVRLDLRDQGALAAALASMALLGDRFLIETMKRGALAEIIVVVTRDPQFGLALTLGAGGVLADLIGDSATLLLPTSRDEIERALDGLGVSRLLRGYRGAPPADRAALIEAVEEFACYAAAHADALLEIDVDPLLVFAQGAGVAAADALIRIGGKETS